MITQSQAAVETSIVTAIEEVKTTLKLNLKIDGNMCPGLSISSQVLISLMERIGKKLGVTIPDNCYIFHDKKNRKQLSIKEAAQKLIKVAKNGK